jgi:hypothetical protein
LGQREGSRVRLIKASEHGLGLYYRPIEGRDVECGVPLWIKQGWKWVLNRALGRPCVKPEWFDLPVMRRIAISTPNVIAALRRLSRDQARPYNFAMSPVLVNLTGSPITLLGPFEKDASRWPTMRYVNIHDGTEYSLDRPGALLTHCQVQAYECRCENRPQGIVGCVGLRRAYRFCMFLLVLLLFWRHSTLLRIGGIGT